MDTEFIIEQIYTERLALRWKLTIRQNNKHIESRIYKTLGAIAKRILFFTGN